MQSRAHLNRCLCNCRNKSSYPLDGNCCNSNLFYQADITTNEGDHGVYIARNAFKERFGGYKASIVNKRKVKFTELYKFFWNLKKEGKTPTIKWFVIPDQSGIQPSERMYVVQHRTLRNRSRRKEKAAEQTE